MESNDFSELLVLRLSRQFELSDRYDGRTYDIVAQRTEEETKSLGQVQVEKKVMAVSFVDESMGASYVESEIEKIPESTLCAFRNISKGKSSIFIRVFVMEDIPFGLIQKVRSYSFFRSEQREHDYTAVAGIILVDNETHMLYSNKAASEFCNFFKIVNPVETRDEEDEA